MSIESEKGSRANAPTPVVAALSFALSRLAFIMTHVVFLYWLFIFVVNDPLDVNTMLSDKFGPLTTVDVKTVRRDGRCTVLDAAALVNNLLWFSLWVGQHFIMARKAYKHALGLWDHPLERPLFATASWLVWLLHIHMWQPITDCVTFNVFDVSPVQWILSIIIITAGSMLIVGLLWTLPDHVFGTDRYQYAQGQYPKGHAIITWFPYGLVRHPAAAGFLWLYWAFPSYTPNHILLAALWTAFILVGTLLNEEGGLQGEDEFGKKYCKYQAEVSAFYPNLACIKRFVTNENLKIE